jgi:hypothetical protein
MLSEAVLVVVAALVVGPGLEAVAVAAHDLPWVEVARRRAG